MYNFLSNLRKFHEDDSGDVVQTAILTAVFAVLAVGGYLFLAPKVKSLFDSSGKELDKANQYSY